ARSLLAEMAKDHDHEVRRSLQGALERLALDLQSSPELRARGERLKAQLLDQPQLRTWVRELWDRAREELRAQAADPGSRLRQRLASILVGAGHRLLGDRALADSARRATESAVVYLCAQFEGEIASLAAGAIGRWDAAETSRRLELLLGADLQYVRINGCVVGAMAGLALHALAQALA
ncbi:MAG: DUF445 family protein, partial [Solirubrobacteraceae bacterium]